MVFAGRMARNWRAILSSTLEKERCMHSLRWKFVPIFGTVLTVGFTLILAARAQESHEYGKAMHGGTVAKTKHHQFEVVLRKDGLNVYPMGQKNEPIDASRLSGTVTFALPGVSKPFTYRLRAAAPNANRTPDSLGLVVDLNKVPTTGSKATFQIAGLPDPTEPTVTFTVPFAQAEAGAITFTKATRADQKAIATQKVCKVSGEDLGAMGTPIKATRGDRVPWHHGGRFGPGEARPRPLTSAWSWAEPSALPSVGRCDRRPRCVLSPAQGRRIVAKSGVGAESIGSKPSPICVQCSGLEHFRYRKPTSTHHAAASPVLLASRSGPRPPDEPEKSQTACNALTRILSRVPKTSFIGGSRDAFRESGTVRR
jgi:hypothetical protein